MIAKIGALVGQSADGIDVEFAINPSRDPQSIASGEAGIFSVIPTNIFAALSSNDSVRVLIFAIIFGIGMVMTDANPGIRFSARCDTSRPSASRFLIGSTCWYR